MFSNTDIKSQDDDSKIVTQLSERWIGRSIQITTLLGLIPRCNWSPPAIFVSGPPATGKTSLVREILELRQKLYVFVDCTAVLSESRSEKRAISQICELFYKTLKTRYKGYTDLKCRKRDNFNDIARWLSILGHSDLVGFGDLGETNGNSIFVVLDNAHCLINSYPTILPALCRLQDFSRRDICILLIDKTGWKEGGKYGDRVKMTGGRLMVPVLFTSYSQSNLIRIISNLVYPSTKKIGGKQPFIMLVNRIVSFCYRGTKNLNEIIHIVRLFIPQYNQLCKDNLNKENNCVYMNGSILSQLKPHFKAIKIFQHDFTQNDITNMPKTTDLVSSQQKKNPPLTLPVSSKLLIIASFLASYNPPSMDIRIFSQASIEKKRKYRHTSQANIKMPALFTGPKSAPLDRVLAIYDSIWRYSGTCVKSSSALLCTQMANIIAMGLIGQQKIEKRKTGNNKDIFDQGFIDIFNGDVRIVCNMSLPNMKVICKSISFPLEKFAYDPDSPIGKACITLR